VRSKPKPEEGLWVEQKKKGFTFESSRDGTAKLFWGSKDLTLPGVCGLGDQALILGWCIVPLVDGECFERQKVGAG
jgi:hypothetical protein